MGEGEGWAKGSVIRKGAGEERRGEKSTSDSGDEIWIRDW